MLRCVVCRSEENVGFEEHVLLDHLLEGFPSRGVCVCVHVCVRIVCVCVCVCVCVLCVCVCACACMCCVCACMCCVCACVLVMWMFSYLFVCTVVHIIRQHSSTVYVGIVYITCMCAYTLMYIAHLTSCRPCASFHGARSQRVIKEPILQRAGEAPVCWGVPEVLQPLLSWRAASRATHHQNRAGHSRHFWTLIN